MHRRNFVLGLLSLGAAGAIAGSQSAEAAMPVVPSPAPEPAATTAEVQPGRDEIPETQNAQVYFVRRRVIVRRRYYRRPVYARRVYYRRPVYVRRVYYRRPVYYRPRYYW
jgi:hypothetical protein